MSERPQDKASLLTQMEQSWQSLTTLLDGVSDDRKRAARDEAGWTVKDHLVHLTAWMRSVLFMLRGEPRHAGLAIAQSLYDSGEIDAINAAIVAAGDGLTLPDAVAALAEMQRRLVAVVRATPDEQLQRTYSDFFPNEPGDERLALDVVWGNSAFHLHEHVEWMAAWLVE
ncbi:MAG: ClbS/DfsB family four-helix bundle protein [Anaerolineales bacterium]|nr:ClbS/DfsB family four-helix bundle protein [Anaerolineales bacterium]MCB9126915.1 ClbS/DfsB family four-helix bundle protein [Ardenticatenales bacterium]